MLINLLLQGKDVSLFMKIRRLLSKTLIAFMLLPEIDKNLPENGYWGTRMFNSPKKVPDLGTFVLALRENCTPSQRIACFVLYLKIINTFLKKNDICILKQMVQLRN